VPGFLFLGANKIYFDWRIKQKGRELRQQFGFYAWIEPKIGKTRQRNPPGSQKEPSTFVLGFIFATTTNSRRRSSRSGSRWKGRSCRYLSRMSRQRHE